MPLVPLADDRPAQKPAQKPTRRSRVDPRPSTNTSTSNDTGIKTKQSEENAATHPPHPEKQEPFIIHDKKPVANILDALGPLEILGDTFIEDLLTGVDDDGWEPGTR
jgi:hypothetical protein